VRSNEERNVVYFEWVEGDEEDEEEKKKHTNNEDDIYD
jgi:hypothetical protein